MKEGIELNKTRVYCAGPIRGNREFRRNYQFIIETVHSLGASALSEIAGPQTLDLNDTQQLEKMSDEDIYNRDIKWLESADCVIAELSGPSIGAGFEVSYALFVKKIPVLVLFDPRGTRLSAMIAGCRDDNLIIKEYTDNTEIIEYVEEFINQKIQR